MARAGASRVSTAMLGDKLLTRYAGRQPGRSPASDGGAGGRRRDGMAEGAPRSPGPV